MHFSVNQSLETLHSTVFTESDIEFGLGVAVAICIFDTITNNTHVFDLPVECVKVNQVSTCLSFSSRD